MQKTIFVDVENCLGCKSCELECAIAHSRSGDLFGALQEGPSPPRIWVRESFGLNIPNICRHCEDMPCSKNCSPGAITRNDEGTVILNPELCDGCGNCLNDCPYGVIVKVGDRFIKCDRCTGSVSRNGEPACVSGCPVGAIVLKSAKEIEAIIKKKKLPPGAKKMQTVYPFVYSIDQEKCTGCMLCLKNCPEQCISGEKKQPHKIDQKKCIQCGICFDKCNLDAIIRQYI